MANLSILTQDDFDTFNNQVFIQNNSIWKTLYEGLIITEMGESEEFYMLDIFIKNKTYSFKILKKDVDHFHRINNELLKFKNNKKKPYVEKCVKFSDGSFDILSVYSRGHIVTKDDGTHQAIIVRRDGRSYQILLTTSSIELAKAELNTWLTKINDTITALAEF